jgi:hypothetical protein
LHLASYSFDFSVFSFSMFLFFTWLSSLKISKEGHFFILHCENVNTNVSRSTGSAWIIFCPSGLKIAGQDRWSGTFRKDWMRSFLNKHSILFLYCLGLNSSHARFFIYTSQMYYSWQMLFCNKKQKSTKNKENWLIYNQQRRKNSSYITFFFLFPIKFIPQWFWVL